MSEVTAQMIERGRKGDPVEASRRRRMNISLSNARQTLTSYSGDAGGPYDSLVRLFAQSAKSASPAIAVLTVAVGAASQLWAPVMEVLAWNALALLAVGLRYMLGSMYLKLPDPEKAAWRWRVYFAQPTAVGRGGLDDCAAVRGRDRAPRVNRLGPLRRLGRDPCRHDRRDSGSRRSAAARVDRQFPVHADHHRLPRRSGGHHRRAPAPGPVRPSFRQRLHASPNRDGGGTSSTTPTAGPSASASSPSPSSLRPNTSTASFPVPSWL